MLKKKKKKKEVTDTNHVHCQRQVPKLFVVKKVGGIVVALGVLYFRFVVEI